MGITFILDRGVVSSAATATVPVTLDVTSEGLNHKMCD